jgi:hypothetical protein
MDSSSKILLTAELLQKFDSSAFDSHGIKALRKIVNAFKCSCRVSNENDEKSLKGQNYVIDSSEAFDKLMVLSLSGCNVDTNSLNKIKVSIQTRIRFQQANQPKGHGEVGKMVQS